MNSKTKSSCISNSFGPQIGNEKLEINKKIKKLIYYDCNNKGDDGLDDDIPDEDEVYIKENLLNRKKDDINNTE
jgi:hypothetical protein